MKLSKLNCRNILAVIMAVLCMFSTSITAFAAIPEEPTVSINNTISSMGNKTVTANQSFPTSDRFVVRANASVKLKVNVVSKSNNASGLKYQLYNTNNNNTAVASGSVTSGSTKTITISQGGTYYFLFSCSNGSYVINYTITI